mmetsp:Transcript_66722/g.177913  ORF Transcript_66722/g.177913 Transcript_66722/m.177913 type:complete len:341 (-) Transcript_66722:762-1784(-)
MGSGRRHGCLPLGILEGSLPHHDVGLRSFHLLVKSTHLRLQLMLSRLAGCHLLLCLHKLLVIRITARLTVRAVMQLPRFLQLSLELLHATPHGCDLSLLVSAGLLRLLNLPPKSPRPTGCRLLVAHSVLLQALDDRRLRPHLLLGLGELQPDVVGLAGTGVCLCAVGLQARPELGDRLHLLTSVRHLVSVQLDVRPNFTKPGPQLIHDSCFRGALRPEANHLPVVLGDHCGDLPFRFLGVLSGHSVTLIQQRHSLTLSKPLSLLSHHPQLVLLRLDCAQVSLGRLAVLGRGALPQLGLILGLGQLHPNCAGIHLQPQHRHLRCQYGLGLTVLVALLGHLP